MLHLECKSRGRSGFSPWYWGREGGAALFWQFCLVVLIVGPAFPLYDELPGFGIPLGFALQRLWDFYVPKAWLSSETFRDRSSHSQKNKKFEPEVYIRWLNSVLLLSKLDAATAIFSLVTGTCIWLYIFEADSIIWQEASNWLDSIHIKAFLSPANVFEKFPSSRKVYHTNRDN